MVVNICYFHPYVVKIPFSWQCNDVICFSRVDTSKLRCYDVVSFFFGEEGRWHVLNKSVLFVDWLFWNCPPEPLQSMYRGSVEDSLKGPNQLLGNTAITFKKSFFAGYSQIIIPVLVGKSLKGLLINPYAYTYKKRVVSCFFSTFLRLAVYPNVALQVMTFSSCA